MEKEKSVYARIGDNFNKELEQIKEERVNKGIDKKKISSKRLTNLIIKHRFFQKIKRDTIDYIFPDKRGLATIPLFLGLALMLIFIILLGLAFFVFSTITNNLMVDVNVGNVNLLNITNDTLGRLNEGFENNVDNIGIALILGMILVMVINGYFIGRTYHRLFIVLDFFILVFVFIFSVYLSQGYSILINASSILNVYVDNMPKSSSFLINLPWYVGIIGTLVIVLSYIIIPKSENEEVINPNVYGY